MNITCVNSEFPRRIVVLRAGALGDVLLTLPALYALRARYPEHRLDAVGYPDLWQVAGDLVDRALSIDRPPYASLLGGALSAASLAAFADVDLIVAWSSHPLVVELPESVRPIAASPHPPPGVHAAAWLLRSVLSPGEEPPPLPNPLLPLTSEERAAGQELLIQLGAHRPVIIHPSAGARWKRWPAERFGRVASRLLAGGRPVVLVEGPADADAVAAVQLEAGAAIPVLCEPRLRILAAALAAGEVVLGNDSGVTHLAAAAGARTVALFGPTDPAQWAPIGDVRVLRACRVEAREQGRIRVCDDPQCMQKIEVEDVLASL